MVFRALGRSLSKSLKTFSYFQAVSFDLFTNYKIFFLSYTTCPRPPGLPKTYLILSFVQWLNKFVLLALHTKRNKAERQTNDWWTRQNLCKILFVLYDLSPHYWEPIAFRQHSLIIVNLFSSKLCFSASIYYFILWWTNFILSLIIG